MIIERLTIRNYRSVKELDLEFEPTLTVLPAKYSETLVKAIGVLTKNEVLSGGRAAWKLGKRAELGLMVRLRDGRFQIVCRQNPKTDRTEWKVTDEEGRAVDPKRFFARIHEAPAEAQARFYDPEHSYEELIKGFLEPERNYTSRAFFRMTEGIGTTRLFRVKLRELRNKGPSGTDDPQRNFELFLQLNTLWDEIEEIRDLHHEQWPIIVGRIEGIEEVGRQVVKG